MPDTPPVTSIEIQYRLLKRIASDPSVTQRALARELGVSLGKVNYCLKRFVNAGWVEPADAAASREGQAYRYALTPEGVEQKSTITAEFLRRRIGEHKALEREIHQLQRELRYEPVQKSE